LRRDATRAERKLCYLLQRSQLLHLSFRRQHPLGTYVVDFYCPTIRLAIEVDGGQHNHTLRRVNDQRRSRLLGKKGIKVLRFWNNEVIENIEGVWEVIAHTAATLSPQRATPTPTLPLSGGGSLR
jgi:very-short-patch-repair endonuclease